MLSGPEEEMACDIHVNILSAISWELLKQQGRLLKDSRGLDSVQLYARLGLAESERVLDNW